MSNYAQQLVEDNLNRPLSPREKIVFLDGNPSNITFGNLAIQVPKCKPKLLEPIQFTKDQKKLREYNSAKTGEIRTCGWCPKEFVITRNQVNKKNVFCCRKCRSNHYNKQLSDKRKEIRNERSRISGSTRRN